MKDWIFKLKVLRWLLADAYEAWQLNVQHSEVDGYDCCNGEMCACQGMTVREAWTRPDQVHRPPTPKGGSA